MAITFIRRWGHSLGIRIPQTVLSQLNINENEKMEINIDDGKIVIQPIKKTSENLEALLSRISEENLHREIDFGIVGNELI